MGDIWNTLITKPIGWLLLQFYNLTGSYALAIMLMALASKIVLLYFTMRGKYSMLKQQRLGPKQQKLQELYKTDKQKYNEELMRMYQDEGINPMGGCLWNFLPLPILLAVFGAVRNPLSNIMNLSSENINAMAAALELPTKTNTYLELNIAEQLHNQFELLQSALPADAAGKLIDINFNLFGINLAVLPRSHLFSALIIIPILSCLTSFAFTFFTQKLQKRYQQGAAAQMAGGMKTIIYLMPLMSLWFAFIMPAAMGVYWTVNNLLSIVQEYFLNRHYSKVLAAEDARKEDLARRKREAEKAQEEADRLERERRIASGEIQPSRNASKKKPKKYKMKKDM